MSGNLPTTNPNAGPAPNVQAINDEIGQMQQVRARNSSFGYFMFLAFMFFMLSGPNNPQAESMLRAIANQRSHELARFKDWYNGNGTSAPDFNVTAPNEPAASSRPKWNNTFILGEWNESTVVQPRVDEMLERHNSVKPKAYWHNVTGFFHGTWSALNVTLPEIIETPSNRTSNDTSPEQKKRDEDTRPTWERNRGGFPWFANATNQQVDMNLREVDADLTDIELSMVRGNMDFKSGDRTVEMDIDGVHFHKNGTLFMFASPGIRAFDIRQLPALLPKNTTDFNRTALAVMAEMTNRINRIKEIIDSSKASGGDDIERDPSDNCTFAVYATLNNLGLEMPQESIDEYENELREPTGITLPSIRSPSLKALLYSENCRLLLEVKEPESTPMRYFWNVKTVNYGAALALVGLITTLLTVRQMETSSSPAALARVSYWTIALQGAMDSYSFVTHLTLGAMVDQRLSYALLVPAFFSSLSGLLFGLRYASAIRNAQPFSARPATTNQPTVAPAPQPEPAAGAAATPPSAEPTPNMLGTVQSRWAWLVSDESPIWLFLFISIIAAFITFIVVVGWIATILTILYSYWIPQIWLNAERGTARRAIRREYIIGITFCRLFLPMYIFGCPDNVIFIKPSGWIWLLFGYQMVQMTLLLMQEFLDPRFFIPKAWSPFPEREVWNYHPANLPRDLESADAPHKCTICFEPIEALKSSQDQEPEHYSESDRLLPPLHRDSLADGLEKSLGKWSYMVPPCHHVAHTKCLESWLAIKGECPVCRRHLPAP